LLSLRRIRQHAQYALLVHSLQWFLIWIMLLPVVAYVAMQSGVKLLGKVHVRGAVVPVGEAGVTALRDYAARWAAQSMSLQAGPYLVRCSRAELGASLPIERIAPRVMRLGHSGIPTEDLAALWASHSRGIEWKLAPAIIQSTLVQRLSELRRRLERAPVPGLIMDDGSLLNGIPGLTIDLLSAIDLIERALRDDATSVQLVTRNVPAPSPLVYGGEQSQRFTETMVSFATKYRTGAALSGRTHNIEMAAQHLDGVVIAPRGELSFNRVVGERSYARGFAGAKEIAYRRIVDGVGGGVCQVAATLHAAAFLGGFDLTEYRPHSRPAHYIDLGLDTMVSWPDSDMRIANPYPFAVRVRAQAREGLLSIRIEGSGKAYPVDWNTQVLTRVKPKTQRLPDSRLNAGESEVIQEAIDGLTVRRTRVVYLPTGAKRETDLLTYPPNDRIVAVGESSPGIARANDAESRADVRMELQDF
jgi:vancomycin resistance protein YoaR